MKKLGSGQLFPSRYERTVWLSLKVSEVDRAWGNEAHCLTDQSLGIGDSACHVGMTKVMGTKTLCESPLCSTVSTNERIKNLLLFLFLS